MKPGNQLFRIAVEPLILFIRLLGAGIDMLKRLTLGCGVPLLLVIVIGIVASRTILKPKPKVERTEVAQRGDVEIKVIETGTIQPLRKVEVKTKASGWVTKLLVDEGAQVHIGQPLATIDAEIVDSQVDALKAQLAAARSREAAARKAADYQQLQTVAGMGQYEQNLEAAKAHLKQIETECAIQPKYTRQNIDIAQANLDAAKASLQAQQEALNLMKQSTHPNNLVAAEEAYEQARAQAENDDKNLNRQKQLLTKGFVSQQSVDAAVTTARVSVSHERDMRERRDHIHAANELEEANQRAQVLNVQSQVHQMEAALEQAKSSVLDETKRAELESARASYRQAIAQLAAARSNQTQDSQRKDEASAAQSDAKQIEGQLHQMVIQQNDTTLYSTMNGVVTKRYVEIGDLIQSAISSFSSGTSLFQIADLSDLLVKINVNEVDVPKVQRNLMTEVNIDAARGVTFIGHVRKVAPSALSDSSSSSGSSSTTSSTTQSVIRFPVEIEIDHADRRLKPGMSARCTIVVARHRNVLRVPISCVQGDGPNATVSVVTQQTENGNTVEKLIPRQVTVGLRGDTYVEILSGLSEGDKLRPTPYTGPPRKTVDMRRGGD
jgi:HlyD family secretion protein